MITRKELIKKYLEFFKSKNHKEIPNVSLVTQNDPTVLFVIAGMQPLVPFLNGQKHTLGKRLVNVQKCIRTVDIEAIGDTYHHTCFEMLGNWSLGDYGKKEAIEFSFEFLTKILEIPLERLAVTVFGGDKNFPEIPKDEESAKIWEGLGVKKERIAFMEGGVAKSKDNWWGPAGNSGPCGPSTEMFYWKSNETEVPEKFDSSDERWVEIWNDVLMVYSKEREKFIEAKQKNIDTGMGVERTVSVLNGFEDNYLSDSFYPIIQEIEKLSKKKYGENEKETRNMRIIADHLKAGVFLVADGVVPSNTERGYVLRRLIRRAVRYGRILGLREFTRKVAIKVFDIYDDYKELKLNKELILDEIEKEETKFNLTLEEGTSLLEKLFQKKKPIAKEKFKELVENPDKRLLIGRILENKRNGKNYSLKNPGISEKEIESAILDGKETFLLFQSYGFPLEMIDEIAMNRGFLVDHHDFREEFSKHQELSKTASAGTFKSGLADNSEQTTKLHTATHLLNEALRKVLKDNKIKQKGSNINPERLRFDFNFDRKITKEELQEIEDWVNKKISECLEVKREEMSLKEALASGAQGEFGAKYPEKVSVYTIMNKDGKEDPASKEICTGPHVENTKDIGKFKIIKEESSSAGVRRIKAKVE